MTLLAGTLIRGALLVGSLPLVASCGAGLVGAGAGLSGSSGSTSEAPPEVSLRSPQPGANDQDPSTVVVLGFSKPIAGSFDPSGLTEITFDGEPVSGHAVVSGSQIEFTPTTPLALGREHLVRCRGSVGFTTGERLELDESWRFTVAGGDWSPPSLVLTFSSILQSAVSDTGRAAAISTGELDVSGSSSALSSLFTSVQAPDGTWRAPLPLAFGSEMLNQPKLIWSRDGERLFALWMESPTQLFGGQLRVAVLEADGAGVWEALPEVLPDDVAAAEPFTTRSGDLHVAYELNDQVFARRLLPSGVWSSASQLSGAADITVQPELIETTPAGDPVVSWRRSSIGSFSQMDTMQFRVATGPGTFGPLTTVMTTGSTIDPSFTRRPKLVHDDQGGALMIYRASTPVFGQLFAVYVDPAGVFGPSTRIDDAAFTNTEYGEYDAAYFGTGEFTLVFRGQSAAGANRSIHHVRWRPSSGAPPSTPVLISDESNAPSSGRTYLRLRATSRAPYGVYVTWLQADYDGNSTLSAVQGRRYDAATGWDPLDRISEGIFGCPTLPGAAPISDRGRRTVIWTEVSDCTVGSGKSGPPGSALYGLSATFE